VRLFVAVDVPEGLKEAIESDVVGPMRDAVPGARWTRPEGRHLTLKFLGNVDDERVDEIAEVLRSAAAHHARFRASFVEVGGFPTLRRPRVLWVGVGEGGEPMAALAADLESALEPLGFDPEGRPFHGHFTLARFPRPRVIESPPAVVVPEERFDVGEFVLFRSQLHPKGARYTALERFPLTG
jgi:2'-5' RNA ligase